MTLLSSFQTTIATTITVKISTQKVASELARLLMNFPTRLTRFFTPPPPPRRRRRLVEVEVLVSETSLLLFLGDSNESSS